jgi:UV DNA damage repair endonuclease
MMKTPRIGFCCKLVEAAGDSFVPVAGFNTRTTTMRWLREHPDQAEAKLWELMQYNFSVVGKLINLVGSEPEHLRMLRLGSELLTGYTEPNWIGFYQQADVRQYIEATLAPLGEQARKLGVRLSFHPGQFCCLASENPDIVNRSILEMEYHADMARALGYGKKFHDEGFKINVHISGRHGPSGVRAALDRLTPEARNLISIENSELTWGLEHSLELADEVALVLDIHHFWIETGEYIRPADDRIKRVIDSWRGERPAIHYSVSRRDLLAEHADTELPDLEKLLAQGYRKQKLRAHSDNMWNLAVSDWAAEHLSWADVQIEAKWKNLARDQFYQHAQKLGVF